MKKIKEPHLKEIINNTLNHIGILNEITLPLKDYRTRVDNLRFQLVENWCLCKWCQLFNTDCENFTYWKIELLSCINNLKLVDIKNNIDKRKILTRMLIDDYDYDKSNMITRIINDKFDSENIMNITQRAKAATAFADEIQNLIQVISVHSINTNSYIQTTFKN